DPKRDFNAERVAQSVSGAERKAHLDIVHGEWTDIQSGRRADQGRAGDHCRPVEPLGTFGVARRLLAASRRRETRRSERGGFFKGVSKLDQGEVVRLGLSSETPVKDAKARSDYSAESNRGQRRLESRWRI